MPATTTHQPPSLTPAQKEALAHVKERADLASRNAFGTLKKRIEALGYESYDTLSVLHHVRVEAPIIIHFNMDTNGQKLLSDTHYKCRHEISGLIDSQRHNVELRLFGAKYSDLVPPRERVKYGAINLLQLPQ
ncbi:hypothetical protein BDK51DRAFT_39018 [Blyttiomyces helicus]|uniref:Uncharacterized protein n=1 Tax=Blyttiomyces helicus TaxID=388810 RepID=A0A4P9W630_9FUNG|nr:hypothetical protein BDK51DRAFT_39018 [Blyttiomyces helicus]|eukprot:RKO87901.1 hypothetical protein BDK51DRAFT_39018 [Blyttiomyces helicus]